MNENQDKIEGVITPEKPEHEKDLVKVHVHYIGAVKPFETDAARTDTVGQIKQLALDAFGLVESGGKTFNLFLHKTELKNLEETIGHLAEGKKELKLDLEEFFIQG